jgi:hypothetical protein
VGRAGVRRYHGVVEDSVAASGRDGVEERDGGGEAARGGVRCDEGGGGDGARVGAEEELGGGEVGGERVEVGEAEGEVRVRRRVEEPGGEEARVEAAERAEEEGRGGKGAARDEAPQEDGALVGQRGDGGRRRRRRHSVVAWLGKPGARRAALGSIGNAGPRGFLGASDFQRFSELSGCAALRSLVVALRGKLSPARRRRSPPSHLMSCPPQI